MQNSTLTPDQQKMIDQVAATMAVEDMPLTGRCYENLHAAVTGEKPEEEIIAEITRRYSHV